MAGCKSQRQMIPTASGFTLIELLVVVGIIGILVGLLIPNLQQSRAKARLTMCTSNLRSIGMSIQGYASENDGTLVPAQEQTMTNWPSWAGLLVQSGYAQVPSLKIGSSAPVASLASRPSTFMCPETGSNPYGGNWGPTTTSQGPTAAYCARDEVNQGFHTGNYNQDNGGAVVGFTFLESYQINAIANNPPSLWPFHTRSAAHPEYININVLSAGSYLPSRILAVQEGCWLMHDGSWKRLVARHENRTLVNTLLMDWHVEAVAATQFPATVGYSATLPVQYPYK